MIEINIHSREQLSKELERFAKEYFIPKSIDIPELFDVKSCVESYMEKHHPIKPNRINRSSNDIYVNNKFHEMRDRLLKRGFPVNDNGIYLTFNVKHDLFVYYPISGVFYINEVRSGIGHNQLDEAIKQSNL